VNAGLAWTHARYVNYSPASLLVPVTNSEGVPIGGNVINPNADLSGTQIPNAPKWTVSASVNYEREFAMGTVGASGDVYHSDNVLLDVSGVNQPAYTLLGARVWYKLPRSKLKFTLWGKNLRNEAVIQATNITADDFGVSYAPPRTYGGSVEYSF
jgi:iron complex outermembrane receptor protein